MRSARAWTMLSPGLIAFALVAGYPLWRAAYWSIHSARAGPARFIGAANFTRLGGDRAVLLACANTAAFAVVYVILVVPLALLLALLLDQRGLRGRGTLRALFFSTNLIGAVYVAGIITALVGGRPFGIDLLAIPWLVMPILLLASLWMGVGYGMVYLLAALQSVNAELRDAARVDGASGPARFRVVTWPAISRTVGFIALTAGIGGLQLFELPFVLYQGTGPGNAAITVSMMLFSAAFEQGDLGYSTAIGWLLTAAVVGISLLLSRFLARETTHE